MTAQEFLEIEGELEKGHGNGNGKYHEITIKYVGIPSGLLTDIAKLFKEHGIGIVSAERGANRQRETVMVLRLDPPVPQDLFEKMEKIANGGSSLRPRPV